MTINKIRGVLYLVAKVLGDVNAIQEGRISRRIGRRIAGKITGRLLGELVSVERGVELRAPAAERERWADQ